MIRLRAIVIAAAVLLVSGAGLLGVYVGILSHPGMLRPTVADVPTARRSIIASVPVDVPAPSADRPATAPAAAPDPAAASAPDPGTTASVSMPPADAASVAPSVVAMTYKPRHGPNAPGAPRGISILHIGDSHTSADFFTGDLRRQLQKIYGNGGSGYVTAGRPHIGVLSSTLKINLSPGWTYKALQRSDDTDEFWMSGFNSISSKAGETLSFTTEQPQTFDVIEIEAIRRPGGGAIDIKLDGATEGSFDLAGDKVEPVVIRLVPDHGPTNKVHEITLTTRSDGVVSISSVAIYDTRAGLIYDSVGYPGATIDILNKLDNRLFVSNLHRLNPQIVVLSFGTNEASRENLDMAAYTARYEKVLDKIRGALPDAAIVMIGPPEAEELPPPCRPGDKEKDKDKARQSDECKHALEATASADGDECPWKTLPKLDAVREAERKIAERDSLVYWNWASIMPKECGAHLWLSQSPPLMAKDHIHFTIAGYKKSAAAFLETLVPVIDKVRSRTNAVSNN